MSKIFSLKSPWSDNKNPIWLGSSLGVYRNLDRYNFPAKLEKEKQKQIVTLIEGQLPRMKELEKPTAISSEVAKPTEKEYLYEQFLSDESFASAHSGEGFVLDRTGRFFATINIHDHLRLYYIDTTQELEESWNKLEKIEAELGNLINYSFSHRFGFLTADPAECGTGMSVSLFLQPTALIHAGGFEEFIQSHADDSILVTGLHGTIEEITGDIIMVKNNYSLGLSEEEILSSLRSFATKFVVAEKGKREKLKNEGDPDMKDKVCRAYGVLEHSYHIEAVEALGAISLLKLGVSLGWISGIGIVELNDLFFNCRRGHILAAAGGEISSEELLHKRAEMIHKVLKNVKLEIAD